jgi:hypothetical protein
MFCKLMLIMFSRYGTVQKLDVLPREHYHLLAKTNDHHNTHNNYFHNTSDK